ncbi:MAG: alpha-2-macroglobulin family protein [Candidatus Sigynarchaeota archaeon]
MEKRDSKPGTVPASKFSEFFELLRVKPDQRVEKVLGGALVHVPQKCKEVADHLKRLLNWKKNVNILVVDPISGKSSPVGRSVIVLDDNYRPLPGAKVRSNTGERGTTDEHGRLFLHDSWNNCSLTVEHGEKQDSFNIYRSSTMSDSKSEKIVLYILTDLDQYRPSQSIHVRGIAWKFKAGATNPVKGAVAIISLVNSQSVEMVRQRLSTDEFGVFDLVIETDFMIKEGAYNLRFEFPEYKHVVEKPITIKNFIPPTLVVEAPPSADAERGKDIEIPVLARYYYGDPVTGGRCTATVSNASGTVAEIEFSTREDGTATARIPTTALEPGEYDVHINGRDAAGRIATTSVRVSVWKQEEPEAPATYRERVHWPTDVDTESHAWDFNASIDAHDPSKCNISFTTKDPGSMWYTRPLYIYWTADGSVIGMNVLYPSHSAIQQVDVPPDASGLVAITILRVERNGHLSTKGRLLFVFPKDRIIGIHVGGPGESRPGAQISLAIHVDPPHDHEQLEVGALLVDRAVRGRDVPLPFSEICQPIRYAIAVQDSWTSLYSDLSRELDFFLGDIIKNIDQYAFSGIFTASDVLHLVKLVERSGFCSSDFIEHHLTSLRCTCGNQPPDAVISFILDYQRAKYKNMDELAKQLAWFPCIVETWKFLIAPGNPLVQALEDEFPGILEAVLYWSTHEFRSLRCNIPPEDFNKFIKSIGATQEFVEVLNDVDKYLNKCPGKVILAVPGHFQAASDEKKVLDYYENMRRQSRIDQASVFLFKQVDFESIICVDQLSDTLVSDQATNEFPRFFIPVVVGYPKYTMIMTDVGGGRPTPTPFSAKKNDHGPVVTVRTYFPDCGYWNPRAIVDGGQATISFKLPDTITQQDFVVQATSKACDAGMATKKILVRQEFFIQPDIPPHLVYNDIVMVSAVVTNRTAGAMDVHVSLDAEGFAITSALAGKIHVDSNAVERVSWTVHATSCGEKHLVFTAASPGYKDVVDQVIFVHPEGEPDIKITRGSIPGGQSTPERLAIDVAPGEMAHYARLSIIPDRSSLALDGLEAMLAYPHGCVEQTMSSVLPNLLVFEALQARHRLTPRYKKVCEDMTAKGLQRLLSFRHADNGWGWWEHDETNLFMTAYVLRGLLKMKALGFHAPQGVINDALEVIAGRQQANGSWYPEQALKWDKVWGKDALSLNEAGMTAWLLLCISETGDWRVKFDSMVKKGISFIGIALDSIKDDPNALAIAGLAMSRLSPENPCIERIRDRLVKIGNGKYWNAGSALGGKVDATAKVLHFLILQHATGLDQDLQGCLGWILGARAANGGWGTTMATASVVEAVLALHQESDPAVNGEILVNGHSRRVHVDASNITEEFVNLRDMNVTQFLVPGKNDVEIRVKSDREVQYQLSEEIWSKERLPGQGAFTIERVHSSKTARIGETINVSVRVTAAQGIDQCAVIEERIPAGFGLDVEAFDASMQGNLSFDYFSRSAEKIVLYPRSASCSFDYSLIASRAFSGTHAGTEVYAMYNPEARGRASPVLLEVIKK